MKTLIRLSLAVVVIVSMRVVPSMDVRADEPTVPAGSEMQEALDQLDSLLGTAGASNNVPPDVRSELSGLQAKFQSLQGDLSSRDKELETSAAALAEAAARLKNLQDENQILKEEIENQHHRIEKAEAERSQAKADFERLFKDETKAGDLGAESARQAAEIERLKGELAVALTASEALGKTLEDERSNKPAPAAGGDSARVRELEASVEEMKNIDAQRKAAMDDLFKQLAAQKKDLGARDQMLAEKQAELDAEKARVAERDRDLASRDEAIVAGRTALTERQQELEAQERALTEARRQADAAAATLGGRETDLQALRRELDEIKLIDAQRRKTLDETLASLATAEQRVTRLNAELDEARTAKQTELDAEKALVTERDLRLASLEEAIAASQTTLTARQQELETQEKALADVRRQAESTAATLAARETDLQGLRGELDQVKLVDAQRRKTLDETLVSLATSEQRIATLVREMDEARAQHTASAEDSAAKVAMLTTRNALLEGEVARMERDVKAAEADRDATLAQATELRNTLKAGDANVVDLEAQVARLTAVDAQRRKAMDQVLLDTAMLEQDKTRLALEVQRLTDTVALKGSVPDAQASDLAEQVRNENSALKARVAKLEKNLQEARDASAVVTESIPPAAGADVAAVLAPVEQAGWQQDKQRLETQLSELRGTAAQDAERIETMTRDLAQAQQSALELTARVKELESRNTDVRESDLFKELEQVNSMLREKMIEVEADRQRLAKLAENAANTESAQVKTIETHTARLAEMDKALTDAQAREDEYKELIERVVPQVEALEQQITALTQERQDLTNRLLQRDEDLQSLKVELERREHRLAKAERVADVLEKARTEVLRTGDSEKLNMHYNMASVYARDGKFAEAENEYLQALRIDPTDADVHYNLGILYDDEMKQPEKAMVHYRRYLQLNPHGPDADQIRNWLMRLEMQAQR